MRIAFMTLLVGAMAGCQPRPQPQQASEPIAKEPSDMRTTLPLVRKLDPNQTGPLELEFDVPALKGDSAPAIFIGVRVKGADSSQAWDAADRLRDAGISAQVHLYRIDGSGPVAVDLERSQWVGRSEVEFVTLPADGSVPGLSLTSADFATMQAVGLVAAGAEYKELEFAFRRAAALGRYRVSVRFAQNREALFKENVELLVAFTAKGK
ncbi:MAG: hypothetical protein ACREO0_03305 [Pseudoxanthomonas sp.]